MPRGAAVIRYEGPRGVVWRVKYIDAAGKQIQETLGGDRDGWTQRKAEAELRERLVRVERKGYRRPRPLTFGAYAATWFDEGKKRRRWKPGTISAYGLAFRRLKESFGSVPLSAIRPRDIAEHVRLVLADYSAATVNLDLSLLHDVLKTAKREELIESNPAEGMERPKIERRRWRILEPVEVAKVAKSFSDALARVVFLTLVLTAVRREELRALRWRDVDLVENVLRVRDSKSEEGVRSIALSPVLAEELWQHRRRTAFQGEDELIFCHSKRGTAIRADWFADELRAALAAAGITGKIRAFHDLRHTAITNDAAAGSSPIAVMAKAGHRNMSTTQTHLHLAGVVFRDEAESLERRLLGGTKLYPSEPISADLSEAKLAEQAGSMAERPAV